MKFNIFFTIRGPAGTKDSVPNRENPVESVNLAGLLAHLANNLPANFHLGVETIGVRVEPVEEP